MKILFIGDIYDKPGRQATKQLLPKLIKKHQPNLVLANPENMTRRHGFSPKHISEMQSAGVDFFTSGNHVWGCQDGVGRLNDPNFPVLRPANFPAEDTPGRGYAIVEDNEGRKVLVISIMGRAFMRHHYSCPFTELDKILAATADQNLAAIFVDVHAEATSEKYALGYYLDGKATVVVGTHTHVPTADTRIFAGGTAYQSDAGFTGPWESIIGLKKEINIEMFRRQIPMKVETETEGPKVLNGILVKCDPQTRKALSIERIQEFC